MLHDATPLEPPNISNGRGRLAKQLELVVNHAIRALEQGLNDCKAGRAKVEESAGAQRSDGVVASAQNALVVLDVLGARKGLERLIDQALVEELVDEFFERCALEFGGCRSGRAIGSVVNVASSSVFDWRGSGW